MFEVQKHRLQQANIYYCKSIIRSRFSISTAIVNFLWLII